MSGESGDSEKKQWTEVERLELAAKLDAELEGYISNLEKKSYDEGWPEDRWQEEMEKHPFFMKKAPEPGDEVSPLIEGLQQLKYSEDENTPEELAANYKEDGNFNYKHRNYRLAILSYTEGIKTKCEDDSLRAQLYNNRAASHFMLKNYRSCLNDCKMALRYQPNYPKALSRAALCCYRTKKFDDCIDLCNIYITEHESNSEISKMLNNANLEKKKQQREIRLREMKEKKEEKEEDRLIAAIELRNINIELSNGNKSYELKDLEPQIPQLAQHRVRLDKEERLIWPVMILYPEYMQTDFIQSFHEDTPFMDHLEDLFEVSPPWDSTERYIVPNLSVYFEGINKASVHKVDISQTLGTIIQQKQFILRGGTPSFIVLIAASDAEKRFLDNYKVSRSL
ncbi:DNA polymerase interacting tetratricopeptide repeat-containing, protein of 47 kDa [Diachasmimorpha longicaudata]|uniref:DNA polymerase interacting tetratricopeptide repeat-containing, protein of 47 kDa n=1 Tax=Diachasmimorpha longicaudata TaxID=58733 RepID=UPI0030B8F025